MQIQTVLKIQTVLNVILQCQMQSMIFTVSWYNCQSIDNMGNNQPRGASPLRQKMAQLTDTLSGEQSVWEQSFEYHNCCGIQYHKVVRKKIIWENTFLRNCQQIKQEFNWAYDLIELVNNCELSKTKYFRQMESIKAHLQVEDPNKTDVLATPAEVENFKKNLKKSVLLSFSHTPKFMNEPFPSKITSAINLHDRNSRIDFERFSKHSISSKNQPNANIKIQKAASVLSGRSMLKKSILSFVDDTISSVLGNEREISKQTARELQIFLTFTMILEKHLSDVNCMLGRIKRLFIVYVEKNYRDPVYTGCHIDQLVDNVKQFILVLKEAVYDYYYLGSFAQGEQDVNLFISNDENIVSAVTALLFRDSTFHTILFNSVAWYNKNREQRFDKLLHALKGSNPEKFMIKDKFCLNHRTIKGYLNDLSAESGDANIDNIDITDVTVQNMQPYRSCMNHVLDLAKSKSPINKMKNIMACSEGITAQIQRFYDLNGLRKEKWMLDADQVLSIFCYILVGARVEHLHTHLFILDHFATNHQMISMAGYYLSVMNCAVEQIQNEFGREIDKQQL